MPVEEAGEAYREPLLLNTEEIERLRDYEAKNKDRRTLVNRFNSRLEDSSQ